MRCEKGVIWECRRVISASRAHSPYVPAVTPSSMSMLTTYKSLSVTESMYSIPFTQLDRGFCLTTVTEKANHLHSLFLCTLQKHFLVVNQRLKVIFDTRVSPDKGTTIVEKYTQYRKKYSYIFLSNRVIPHCWNSHLQVKSCIQNLI